MGDRMILKLCTDELDRITGKMPPGKKPDNMLAVEITGDCKQDAKDVLVKLSEVLSVLFKNALGEWPTIDAWGTILPTWFVDSFSPEMLPAEAEKWLEHWRTLPINEQLIAEKEKGWSFSNWIEWFRPDDRQWYWWNGIAEDKNSVRITLITSESPFPHGVLDHLLEIAGISPFKYSTDI